jgi:hypothetical protein
MSTRYRAHPPRAPRQRWQHQLGHIVDDRFDRRELLLHLGDVLEATNYVAKANRPYTPVAQLATHEASLQAFPFLRYVTPCVRAKDFPERAASAYALWPKALLELELNRIRLASSVRQELFDDNPEGWESYTAYIREKVGWFGVDLLHTTATAATSVNTLNSQESPTHASPTRTGWPWTPTKSAT